MQLGIVGLPFSGKSTLFQTITNTHLDASALAKAESHQAIIKVPDERLDKLTDMFNPKKKTNAAIEVVDVVGLQKADTGSTKFTGNFLASVKNNDALIQVVRLFENDAVPHPEGKIDMMRDIRIFEDEFILSDLHLIEKRIETVNKQIQKTGADNLKRELPILEKCYNYLQDEIPLRDAEFYPEELQLLRSFQLLSIKPLLIALNLDEEHISETEDYLNQLVKTKVGSNTKALAFSGQIEMEMGELSDEESYEFMEEYGIKESALNAIIRESYSLLGLQSFFTVGEDECRAWTIKKGSTAQDAAGVIHSDFYKKFIRAEVVHYDDFVKHGSFSAAKEKGDWRLEGKEYIVKDGDIISVRHS